eukprot:1223375-Heterocapsa_arctica.AAC.1
MALRPDQLQSLRLGPGKTTLLVGGADLSVVDAVRWKLSARTFKHRNEFLEYQKRWAAQCRKLEMRKNMAVYRAANPDKLRAARKRPAA